FRVGIAGKRVEDAELAVLSFQRIEFVSIYDLVLAPVAVDEPHRDGQRLVRRVLGHAFEGRDSDPSRDEHRRAHFVQDEVADRAEDANLVTGLEGREGALVGGVREADRVFEVRAGGARREGHGARVHALLGLQLQERKLRGPEREARRFLSNIQSEKYCSKTFLAPLIQSLKSGQFLSSVMIKNKSLSVLESSHPRLGLASSSSSP